MTRNGFTLVEMVVVLGIFALLAAAGVGVLRSSVDVQGSVATHLDGMSGIARLNALLSNDLGQVVDRPSRGPGGERPAFVGRENGMEFVSAGRANLDGAPRSELQRVEWRSAKGALHRTGFAAVDGMDDGLPSSMAGNLRRVAFRYRMLDGRWSSSFASNEQQRLPTAVELTMTPSDGEPIVMVFALPAGAQTITLNGASQFNDDHAFTKAMVKFEELMKKYELSAENAWTMAQGIYTGLTTDPIGFGRELGKSLLDWDTLGQVDYLYVSHLRGGAWTPARTGSPSILAPTSATSRRRTCTKSPAS